MFEQKSNAFHTENISNGNVRPHSRASPREIIDETISKIESKLREVNERIYTNPELGYNEHIAHSTILTFLHTLPLPFSNSDSLTITPHAHNLATSFSATYSPTTTATATTTATTTTTTTAITTPTPTNLPHPSIIFNAEYDALPNTGHACGHNLIAVAALTAFVSLCQIMFVNSPREEFDGGFGSGSITLLGCPAEEGGAGKVRLLEEGAYGAGRADVVLMGHPGPEGWQGGGGGGGGGDDDSAGVVDGDDIGDDGGTVINGADGRNGGLPHPKKYTGTAGQKTTARTALIAHFWGREAHAGGMPWEGVNALDAVVGAYNLVAMLRQQIRPEERIHACICRSENVCNVITAHASVKFATRAPTFSGASSLLSRIRNCIDGAALGTGCRVEYEEEPPYLDIRLNATLNSRYVANMAFDSSSMNGESKPLCRSEKIRHTSPDVMSASTDMGNVSYVVPSLHVFFGIPCPKGVTGHHPSFTAASGTEEAFASAVRCGKGLALTGWDCLVDEKILRSVRKDFEKDKMMRETVG